MSQEIANKLGTSAKQVNVNPRSVTNVPLARGIASTSPTQSGETGNAGYSPLTPITAVKNKLDPSDTELKTLIDNNQSWAEAVTKAEPTYFKEMALKQEPKILWIGCSDSRVPAEQVVQLGPGEIFVHRNIANVVHHTDMNCLSVLQYAVEVLKVQHIVVCGHYHCGGVKASLGTTQFGLIDNWLRTIKDVYREHQQELDSMEDQKARERRLVELNVVNSAMNVASTTIVQNAWQKGQPLTVHGWAHNIEDGLINKLNLTLKDNSSLEKVYRLF